MRFPTALVSVMSVVVLAVAGCSRFETPVAARAFAGEVLCSYDDDHEQLEHLTQGLLELDKQGKAADTETLIEQLSRDKCSLKLSAKRTGKMSPAKVYRRFKDSVVAVSALYYCENCEKKHASVASGFIISESGVVVTNYHVLDDEKKEAFAVMTADGEVHAVKEVLAANERTDVAIVRIDGFGFKPIGLKADAPVGSAVTVISHPSKHFYMLTQGYISAYSSSDVKGRATDKMLITADFGGGSSGGPIIDGSGNVAGMVCSTTPVYAKSKSRTSRSYAQMVIKSCVTAKDILALIDDKEQ